MTRTTPPALPAPPLPAAWLRGVNLTSYGLDAYTGAPAQDALEALKALGGTDVSVVVTWYMRDKRADEVRPERLKTPSDASVVAVLRAAQALGLKVTLKPQVDVLDGTFRGRIRPADRAAWFDSYTDFVVRTADLAQRVGADRFVVGTELASLSADDAAWRKVVEAARTIFSGRMTYAANWVQEAESVGFWDVLDEIGIDAYMPLTQANQPSTQDLVAAWKPWTDRMRGLHDKTGKPVLFTELGYPARAHAAAEPAEEDASDAPDPSQQARLYEAALLALQPLDFFEGVVWWDWPADGRRGAGSYTPRDKLAEDVLRRFWARPDLGPTGPSGAIASTTGPTGPSGTTT